MVGHGTKYRRHGDEAQRGGDLHDDERAWPEKKRARHPRAAQ